MADLLNPVTPILGGAALSSANAIPVNVISGGGTGITVDTTTITGGTTTRLLYDNGGTVGETAAVTYASASATLALGSVAILGFLSSASAVDTGISRISAGKIGIGNGTAGDVSGGIQAGGIVYQGFGTTGADSGGAFEVWNNTANAKSRASGFRTTFIDSFTIGLSGDSGISGAIGFAATGSSAATLDAIFFRSAAGSIAVGGATASAGITGTILASNAVLTGTLRYGGVTAASTVTGTGSLVLNSGPTFASATTVTYTAGGTITYGGVTFASTVTGSGSLVGATSPTLSGLTLSSASTTTFTAGGTITYGGVTWASTTTGTGSNVLSVAPAFTGNATFVSASATGIITAQNGVAASASVVSAAFQWSSTGSFGLNWAAAGSVVPTIAAQQGSLFINTTGSSTAARIFVRGSAAWIAVTTAS